MLGRSYLLRTASRELWRRNATNQARELAVDGPYFRCNEDNPVNHGFSHETKFYTIPSDLHQQLFQKGGITSDFGKNIKTFNEFSIMIRKPALELISYLKAADYESPVIRYVLYGRQGAGKTVTLAHLLHFAYCSNWLIVHNSWVPYWTRTFKEITPSTSRPGRMDNPKEATLWLQQFKSQNINLLNSLNLKTTQSYTWTKREVTEKDKPLMEVIDQGLNRIKFAADCVAVVMKEIKFHANAGRVRTCVIVDGVNALYSPTRVRRDDKSAVEAKDITLVNALRKLVLNDWKNGAVILTADTLAGNIDNRENPLPRYLLQKEGYEAIDPFIPIKVNNYSNDEALTCIDYFIDRMWIQTERGRSLDGKKELMFLSGNNPAELSELCASR